MCGVASNTETDSCSFYCNEGMTHLSEFTYFFVIFKLLCTVEITRKDYWVASASSSSSQVEHAIDGDISYNIIVALGGLYGPRHTAG